MTDCQLYGLRPWGHHLTSLLLHVMNVFLVFLLLHQITRAPWRSLLVAALFGLHPLRVESVAWVAERKDVLSACFGLLALLFYARYVEGRRENAECRTQNEEPRLTHHVSRLTFHVSFCYLLSLFFFTLGLMSKPMLVTVPFLLLLLDYWPLQRLRNSAIPRATILSRLVVEKIPFFVLAAASSIITLYVQQSSGAVKTALPLLLRMENAMVCYCCYLGKLLCPTALSAGAGQTR
jgi:4-amino-4-deoxy-L-arabinose transferase-like glycosyltransferase